jgi:two-component system OmpR family response regulator
VIEDDVEIAEGMRVILERRKFAVHLTHNGDDGLEALTQDHFDVAIVDIGLPRRDGFAVTRQARAAGIQTPVLMLTARDAIEDRVHGLNSGADDYLVKPFSFSELLARVRAMSRRGPLHRAVTLEVGDLRLDSARHQAWRGDAPIDLSRKEYAVLEALMRRPGDVLSRFELLEQVWGYGYENRSNVVEVYVRYLREKIDRPFGRHSLQTIRGVGYRVCDEA